jgi:hypothetical protein
VSLAGIMAQTPQVILRPQGAMPRAEFLSMQAVYPSRLPSAELAGKLLANKREAIWLRSHGLTP